MDPFSVEPPRWLQEDARPINAAQFGNAMGNAIGMTLGAASTAFTEDESFHQAFQEGMMNQQDPLWKVKLGQLQANTTARQAQAQAAWSMADARTDENRAWLKDTSNPAWQDYITGKTTEPPPVTSKAAQGLIQKRVQSQDLADYRKDLNDISRTRAENNSATSKIAVNNTKNFNDRLAALTDNDDQEAVSAILAEKPNTAAGTPSQKMMQLLANAEAAHVQRAKAAAAARGDQVSTTVAGSKVTERFAPKKPGDAAEPKLIPLPNGQFGLYIPGSKGVHVLKNSKQEAEGKMAYEMWSMAAKSYKKAKDANPKDPDLAEMEKDVQKAKDNLNLFWQESSKPAPTGTDDYRPGSKNPLPAKEPAAAPAASKDDPLGIL